jgi:hypothetical protein
MSELANARGDSQIDAECDTAESFRHPTRERHPHPKYRVFEVGLPASMVIKAVNALMGVGCTRSRQVGRSTWEGVQIPDAKQHLGTSGLPKCKMVLSSKWEFRRKWDANGNVVHHRTRIIIKTVSRSMEWITGRLTLRLSLKKL